MKSNIYEANDTMKLIGYQNISKMDFDSNVISDLVRISTMYDSSKWDIVLHALTLGYMAGVKAERKRRRKAL